MIGWGIEKPEHEVRLSGIGEFEKVSADLMKPVFLDNCGNEEDDMVEEKAPITERQSAWLENALAERDADWQEHMQKVSRLHSDSMELAKSIARTNALEEAAAMLDARAGDNTYYIAAARDVRSLIVKEKDRYRTHVEDVLPEPVEKHTLTKLSQPPFAACSCGETKPKGVRTTAQGWHDMHLTKEGIK